MTCDTRTCADERCAKPLPPGRASKYCNPRCRKRRKDRERHRRTPRDKVVFRRLAKGDERWSELRREAVARLRNGEKGRDIARGLEISEDTVAQWKRRARLTGALPEEVMP